MTGEVSPSPGLSLLRLHVLMPCVRARCVVCLYRKHRPHRPYHRALPRTHRSYSRRGYLRFLVLILRRRDLRGRQPPCGTDDCMRSFMMRTWDTYRCKVAAWVRRAAAWVRGYRLGACAAWHGAAWRGMARHGAARLALLADHVHQRLAHHHGRAAHDDHHLADPELRQWTQRP